MKTLLILPVLFFAHFVVLAVQVFAAGLCLTAVFLGASAFYLLNALSDFALSLRRR